MNESPSASESIAEEISDHASEIYTEHFESGTHSASKKIGGKINSSNKKIEEDSVADYSEDFESIPHSQAMKVGGALSKPPVTQQSVADEIESEYSMNFDDEGSA